MTAGCGRSSNTVVTAISSAQAGVGIREKWQMSKSALQSGTRVRPPGPSEAETQAIAARNRIQNVSFGAETAPRPGATVKLLPTCTEPRWNALAKHVPVLPCLAFLQSEWWLSSCHEWILSVCGAAPVECHSPNGKLGSLLPSR